MRIFHFLYFFSLVVMARYARRFQFHADARDHYDEKVPIFLGFSLFPLETNARDYVADTEDSLAASVDTLIS